MNNQGWPPSGLQPATYSKLRELAELKLREKLLKCDGIKSVETRSLFNQIMADLKDSTDWPALSGVPAKLPEPIKPAEPRIDFSERTWEILRLLAELVEAAVNEGDGPRALELQFHIATMELSLEQSLDWPALSATKGWQELKRKIDACVPQRLTEQVTRAKAAEPATLTARPVFVPDRSGAVVGPAELVAGCLSNFVALVFLAFCGAIGVHLAARLFAPPEPAPITPPITAPAPEAEPKPVCRSDWSAKTSWDDALKNRVGDGTYPSPWEVATERLKAEGWTESHVCYDGPEPNVGTLFTRNGERFWLNHMTIDEYAPAD